MSKGKRTSKGYPELYDEVKKRVNLSLTPTAIAGLDELAQELDLSRSEFVEQVGRGLIPLAKQKSLSEEFAFSPIRFLSLAQCDRLPEKMGVFLVTNYAQFAYVGSSSNLYKRFQEIDFLNGHNKSETEIMWIECDRPNVIPKIEQQLITQFNYLSIVDNTSSGSLNWNRVEEQ